MLLAFSEAAMFRALSILALVAAAACAPASAADQTFNSKCSLNWGSDGFFDGVCQQTYGEDAEGRFLTTVSGGGQRFVIVTTTSGAPWSKVTINGRPGLGHEMTRGHRAYSTLDLGLTVEVFD